MINIFLLDESGFFSSVEQIIFLILNNKALIHIQDSLVFCGLGSGFSTTDFLQDAGLQI
jgi:hypothetical protein